MKTVRLYKTGHRAEYDDASADWLVSHGYAEAIAATKKAEPPKETPQDSPPPARRGRPPKARS